jgi:deoxycytidylate deaminase
MVIAAQKGKSSTSLAASNSDLFSNQSGTVDALRKTHTGELVIALCGPIGSPLHEVAENIQGRLREVFDYEECSQIRLSEFIETHAGLVNVPIPENTEKNAFSRREALIRAGDELRKRYGGAILAELAIDKISMERQSHKQRTGDVAYRPRRVCHIVDSIKNQEELELLRTVYREMLYVIGVFVPVANRENNLKKKGMQPADISKLIDLDSGEEKPHGQTVRDTFPQSDFFLRIESGTDSQLRARVERYLHLILGTKIVTPTRAETAMYAAASAAGSSACLSRQVGAALTDAEGEILSIGWNDVPKPFGGLYLSDHLRDPTGENDHRCWNMEGGKCFNDAEKELLAQVVVDALGDLVSDDDRGNAILAVKSNAKLRSLIEFSRSIHAEMHAILTAAKTAGEKISGGKLFVTTYPCHSCARHIIASGISEVYYIEPYRKSLATKLHDDAITENESEKAKVRLLPYDGVAPSRFLALFRMTPDSRKIKGKMIVISPKNAMPRIEKSLEALPALEGLVVQSLKNKNIFGTRDGDSENEPNSPRAA